MKATAAHMVQRHGIAEVSQWKWEVWNEVLPVLPVLLRVVATARGHH